MTIAGTGLTWLSICSIRSTIAASTYLGDCRNIIVPYTTSANMSMTQSSSLFSMMYLSRKSHWTHSFFPFYLVMGTKMLASIFIICANFFWLLPKDLIRIWWRYSKQSSILFHCWNQVFSIEGETPIRRVPKQDDGLKQLFIDLYWEQQSYITIPSRKAFCLSVFQLSQMVFSSYSFLTSGIFG